MLPQFFWVHSRFDCVDWEALVFLVSYIPSGSCNLYPSSSAGFPELWEEGFGGDILFRTKCSKVCHTVHNVWLWISTVLYILCRRKFLWWWLSKALLYEYSRMSLAVILLLLFLNKINIWFSPRTLFYLVSGSQSPSSVRHDRFCRREQALSQIRHWLVTPTGFVPPLCPSIAFRQDTTVDLWFCSCAGIYLYLLVVYQVPSCTNDGRTQGWKLYVGSSSPSHSMSCVVSIGFSNGPWY